MPSEQTEEIEEQIKIKLNTWQAILACIAGFILLIFGADILVEGAAGLAKMAGLPEAVIGVTLVAFGGSVPELVTSLIAAIHKRSEIVFGNIIGSNLFNILGILGTTSIIKPIEVSTKFLHFDLPILLLVTFTLSAIIYYLPEISRKLGFFFFSCYIAYVAVQFL